MKRRAQITTSKPTLPITDRPPIFEATRSLGLNDRKIAGLMGISAEAISQFVLGKKPLPRVRYIALLYLVTRLTDVVGAAYPPQSRYARRAAVACESAKRWAELARDEIKEDVGDVFRAEDIERGIALGEKMLAKLEMHQVAECIQSTAAAAHIASCCWPRGRFHGGAVQTAEIEAKMRAALRLLGVTAAVS